MRRGNVWNVSFLAGLVAAVCMLSACTGSAGDEAAPVSPSVVASPSVAPPSPSPSPTPSPTPSPPNAPEASNAADLAGAERAIQYFFDARTYAFETGDTSLLRVLSHPDCAFCTSSVASAKEAWGDTDGPSGRPVSVDSAEYHSQREDRFEDFLVTIKELPREPEDGTAAEPLIIYEGVVGMHFADDRWIVRAVNVDEVDPK